LRCTPPAWGLVLLAYAPADVQEQVLGGLLERWTPKTIGSPVQLRRVLAEVRQRGCAVSDGQVTMDALSVGVPIRASGDQVVAALSLVVHAEGAQPGALAAAGPRGGPRDLPGTRLACRAAVDPAVPAPSDRP
jgi:DNA-binding IclR family transcriptional regulator